MSDRDSADAAAAQAAALTDGALHIVINNAGVTKPAMFDKTTQESFRLLFDIHVMGAFNVTQAALPYIPTDGTGRIVNVTSAAGLTGTLGQVNYSAAKAGIIGFTKSLARELATKNIMRQRAGAAGRDADDRNHPHQREIRGQHDEPHPDEAVGRAVGDRGGIRFHGVGRRVLHHRTGSARRRRHGHVTSSAAPLAGVTVVAMEQAVAAPMCTRVLADFGARVIKVENPEGR